MSLAIDTNRVTEVLLADGWHHVVAKTFDLDAYEFGEWFGNDYRGIFGGGQSSLVTSTGFMFLERVGGDPEGRERLVMGPLTAILAIRCTP